MTISQQSILKMADNKKSFLLYADLIHTVKKLPDGNAGTLFKLILEYVNDLNPNVDSYDILTQVTFEPIKLQLKRDLKRWEEKQIQRIEAGRRSAENRKQKSTEHNESQHPSTTVQHPSTVNVTVTDTVTVKENNYKNTLLSEIIISDFSEIKTEYFEIAKTFQLLFKNNLTEAGAQTSQVDKAKGTWIDDIRLIIEKDKYSLDDLRDVYRFLQKDQFWKQNILSTSKLREQMPKLKLKIHNGENRTDHKEGTTWNQLAEIVYSKFDS